MTRYIDADYFLKEYCEPYPEIYKAMSAAIKHMPTADVAPVRHGKWEWKKYSNGYETWECSVCRSPMITRFWYCPNCGAKMDAEREEE